MAGRVDRECQVCGSCVGFCKSDDGFFYCGYCNSQADDIVETGMDDEQVFSQYTASRTRTRPANIVPAEPVPLVKPTTSQFLDHPIILDHPNMDDDGLGPTEPSDFGSFQKKFTYEEYYSEIRLRYLKGLQIMIQLQSQALIEKFNVSPLIVGLVGPIWLRFLASTRIQADEWADCAVHDSEAQKQGEANEFQPIANNRSEPVNIYGKRLVYIWNKSLRSTLPISCSLAISFLVCHLAREPILPSDMLKWTLEGKLPYFAAFSDIEKQLGPPSGACPISSSRMFRPLQAISSQKLESMAAEFAQKIGLVLPPVNFYAIASRYLRQLSLPIGELLPLSRRICEWSNPPELYLSANESRMPTSVCVMSILIVAIRILFNINGYGIWESSLSSTGGSLSPVRNEDTESQSQINSTEKADENLSSLKSEPSDSNSGVPDSSLSVVKLLKSLEAKYYELDDRHEYSCDLPSYLQYCKDVVFSGLHPPHNDFEEELVEELWEFYQKNKGPGTSDKNERSSDVSESRKQGDNSTCSPLQKSDDDSKCSTDQEGCTHRNQDSANDKGTSKASPKEKAVNKLKLDMNENQFCYIPPRVKVKNKDYLHYARKRKDVYIYAVHADYYILLRCCAKVAQVETRVLHSAVLSLERRLQRVEKEIEPLLHIKPNVEDFCRFCEDKNVQK